MPLHAWLARHVLSMRENCDWFTDNYWQH